MPSSPKPAFGQVWQWGGSVMMLVAAEAGDRGRWETVSLPSGIVMDWSGLHDDPEERIDGWELLSKENE